MKIGLIRATLIVPIALVYGSLPLPAISQNQPSRVQKVSKEVAQANSTYCAGIGFPKGSAQHAQCVVNLNSMPAPAPAKSAQTASITEVEAAARTSRTRNEPAVSSSAQAPQTNESYCAGLGFKPGSKENAQCVINLGASSVPKPQAVRYVGSADPKGTSSPSASSSSVGAKPSLTSNGSPASANAAYERDGAEEAFRINLAAARAGVPSAQSLAATHYLKGTGTPRSVEKGMFWANKAAVNKDPRGYNILAVAYLQGEWAPTDLQKAYDYAKLAKAAGYYTDPSKGEKSLFDAIKASAGEDAYNCMTFGFRQGAPDFAQCLMQMSQARQQHELAQQQYQIQRMIYEQQVAVEKQRQLELAKAQQLAAEQERERERKEASDRLMALSADLLCPKTGRGIFAEPVAGCGRNKNVPRPPTVNVTVQPQTRYCGATAAGPIPCRF